MDDTGAEIIDHYWALIKNRTFRTPYARNQFKKLNTLKPLAFSLLSEHKGNQYDVDRNKDRLVFSNKFKFLEDRAGEYVLLSGHFFEMFSTKSVKTNTGYRVSLRMLPCFWLNSEMITVLKSYWAEDRTYFTRKGIEQGDGIGTFKKAEFSSLNFIETGEGVSETNIIDIGYLSTEGKKQHELLNRYLEYNMWIMPEVSIVDVSQNYFFLFSRNRLIPVIPYRVILIIEEYLGEEHISTLFGEEALYKKFRASYFDSLFELKTEIIYVSNQICESQHVAKGDLYNCLIFTFLDLYQERTYPILFEIYRKNINAMDIMKESVLFWFRKRYLRSKKMLSVHVDKSEMAAEIFRLTGTACNKLKINFAAISRIDTENAIDLPLAELAPIIIYEGGRLFKIPLLLGMIGIPLEVLGPNIQLIEDIVTRETSQLEKGIAMQSLINKVEPNKNMSLNDAQHLIESMEQWLVLSNYMKALSYKIGGSYEGT